MTLGWAFGRHVLADHNLACERDLTPSLASGLRPPSLATVSGMSTPPGPAPVPQRLCPHCASVAVTSAPKCPWCGRGYRRRIVLAVAALLAVQAAVVIGVVLFALAGTGETVQDEVDAGIVRIEREIDRQVEDIDDTVRQELRDELDRRLPRVRTP